MNPPDSGAAYTRLLDALRDAGKNVIERGGRATAQCPGHDDDSPSLSITPIDGSVLIYCHAGCDTNTVTHAVGLTMADLYDDARGITYAYPDGRKVHRSPDKQFRQSGNTQGNSLFHVDRIASSSDVFVVEGEKDVLAIEAAGGSAVCPAMGAGKAHRFDWSLLAGKRVVIVADDDEPGVKHAADIEGVVKKLAASCRVVTAPRGKDAADHIAAGGTLDQLRRGRGDPIVDGATFILDQPDKVPALWGDGQQVLWAEGEALMIAGGQGLGKTTLAGQLVRALLGCGDGEVLGLPVHPVEAPILYLAMDRPRQIARSLGRQFTENDRDALESKLLVRPGPPALDMAAQPLLLAGLAAEHHAGVVIVDSLKDAAIGLSDDAVGAGWNRARQALLNSGAQLLELHHVVKRGTNPNGPITSVADIYGSTWLTSGVGSIALLHGEPGDPIVGFRHVKQPAEEVGPWRLLHEQTAGRLTVEHRTDLIALVRESGADGLTARAAAAAINEKGEPGRADVEKARRLLDKLASEGILVRVEGSRGRGQTASWYLVERNHAKSHSEQSRWSESHAPLPGFESHAEITHITTEHETAGQGNHGVLGVNHTPGNHAATPPLGGVVAAGERAPACGICNQELVRPESVAAGLCAECQLTTGGQTDDQAGSAKGEPS